MVRKYTLLFILILAVPFIFVNADDTAELKLDKDTYIGLSNRMKITLTAPLLNKSPRLPEVAIATITTTDNPIGINVFLTETNINTSVFTAEIRFNFAASNASERTIKIRNGIRISVKYGDMTAEAAWQADDATIQFNGENYSGLGAVPEIILKDYDMNAKPNEIEEICVAVISSSDAKGILVKLREEKADSGIFKGTFTLTTGVSNPEEGKLHVGYNDKLSVSYTDKTSSSGFAIAYTGIAAWSPQTAAVTLNNSEYTGLNSRCSITVRDNDLNLRRDAMDTTYVKVISDHDSAGIYIKLYESGVNTGVFTADLQFSKNTSGADRNTIKVGPASNIKVLYSDDWNAENVRYKAISAEAVFRFAEGALTISGSDGQELNNSIVINVKDPDADLSIQQNTIPVKVTSSKNSQSLTLWLEETGASSGSFKGTLYFSAVEVQDKAMKDVTLIVSPGDVIEITYNDMTVPEGKSPLISESFTWMYQEAEVSFNKESYSGYNSSADIIIKDSEANKDPKAADKIKVKLSGTSMQEFTVTISETSTDSGQFRGTIYFGKQGNLSKGIVKVVPGDIIRLVYEDQGEYGSNAIEAAAVWQPSDGSLELNRQEYSGNAAEVKITLKDMDIGNDSATKTAVVFISITGRPGQMRLSLVQSGDSGTFTGNLIINGAKSKYLNLKLQDGDQLEVKYMDEDNTENVAVEREASAVWRAER